MPKLTKRVVDALKPEASEIVHWDAALSGFGVRVWPTGRKSYEDVRLHDLRHSFASRGLIVGEGLPMIGKLLGHSQVQTTARYAHLANEPIKSAADRIAQTISASSAGS